jgi:hypothetical protein
VEKSDIAFKRSSVNFLFWDKKLLRKRPVDLIFLIFSKIERLTGRYSKNVNCPAEDRVRGISEIMDNQSKSRF